MEKIIAVIASLDTKETEVLFLIEQFHQAGHRTYIIDIGAKKTSGIKPDINAVEIAEEAGHKWSSPMDVQKHEMVSILKDGTSKLIPRLYERGLFDAIISIGGLQNTTIAVSGMKKLPIGIPKIMVSTVACGKRRFETIVGYSDITVIPSIADFSGRNVITDSILKNAAAAITGMVEKAGNSLSFDNRMLVGMTTMGVVNRGSEKIIQKVKKRGYQLVSFHSTGVGGKIMDDLIDRGIIKATIEFSLHEIIGELFGGYSSGETSRLINSAKKGIPQLIIPGACDFIDINASELKKEMFNRKHLYHNSELVHIKLNKSEITEVGKLIAQRLNSTSGPVVVMIPLKGFRDATKKGEPLYNPEVDKILIKVLKNEIKGSIKIIEIDANINDDKFVLEVLNEFERLLS